jgi:NAD(P)-dependent dehydrogenase (short-subunit alcohol dehydrogenase family)
MSERVVLVTGALAGIGRATATAFAREGAAIVVSGRRDEDGKAFAAKLRALGVEAEYLRADVSIENDVQALVDGTVKTFGKLDVAVSNAGFTGNPTNHAAGAAHSPIVNGSWSRGRRGRCCAATRLGFALSIVPATTPRPGNARCGWHPGPG